MAATPGFKLENPTGVGTIADLAKKIAEAVIDLAIPVAVVMFVYAGFLYLTAGQYPSNVTKAGNIMKYTALGLVLIFGGNAIVDLIRNTLLGK